MVMRAQRSLGPEDTCTAGVVSDEDHSPGQREPFSKTGAAVQKSHSDLCMENHLRIRGRQLGEEWVLLELEKTGRLQPHLGGGCNLW